MIDPLTEREKRILSTFVEVWDEHHGSLSEGLSYGDVFCLLDRLGVPRPTRLSALIDKVDGPESKQPNRGDTP